MIHFNADQQEQWDNAIKVSPDGGFLQSWAWGEFQESLGNSVYNTANDTKTWFAQCIQLKAGNQWILSIPRGPVYVGDGKPDTDSLKSFLTELKAFAKERGCFVLRFDMPYSGKQITLPYKKSRKVTNPEHTLILQTEKSEEDLLKEMKPKWRYNINLAEKKGVTIRWGWKEEDAKLFTELMNKTTQRQAFASYDVEYFKKLVEILSPKEQAAFLFAEYEGKTIAGLLMCAFGSTAIYLHGASDYEYRKIMAPHLLQWTAIKDAKKFGANYDFWGVAADPPANKAEEHWGGVTRFKKGFAPKQEISEYMGTYEIPVKQSWYLLYRLRSLLK